MPELTKKVKGGERIFNTEAFVLFTLLYSAFIHLFNKYLLNFYYAFGILSTGNTVMRKQEEFSALRKLSF